MNKEKENFRSDFGMYASSNLPYLYAQENYVPAYDSSPDTLGNMSFGTGAIGDIRQDIKCSIVSGFGRENNDSHVPVSVRRRFNIEFQRATYNKCKHGVNKYEYECGLPKSYYPITYTDSFPYSQNYDPYFYPKDEIKAICDESEFLQKENDLYVNKIREKEMKNKNNNMKYVVFYILISILTFVVLYG